MKEPMKLEISCLSCSNKFEIVVDRSKYIKWCRGGPGTLIQNLFPELSTDERELMISRTCGVCWETMYG